MNQTFFFASRTEKIVLTGTVFLQKLRSFRLTVRATVTACTEMG